MKIYQVEVPKAARDQLNIDHDEPMAMRVTGNQLQIRPARLFDSLPQIKFRWYLLPALALITLYFADVISRGLKTVPVNGENYSLATICLLLGTVSGTLAFGATFISEKVGRRGPAADFSWRTLPPILIACGMIVAFGTVAGFWLIKRLFHGARFDIYTTGVLAYVVVAAVIYLMINLAMTLTTGVITNLMTAMVLSGVVFSMATNADQHWWRHNFSFLGTNASSSHWEFNITLVFSALLMITLVDYLFVNLAKKYPGWRLQVTRWLLIFIATCLGGIGFFPNDPEYHLLHDRIAMWMVYGMLILVVVIRWTMPMVTKSFLNLSYVIGGLLALDYIAFKYVGYLSLTAFEILSFGLGLAWILLLFQVIESLVELDVHVFPVHLVVREADDTKQSGMGR